MHVFPRIATVLPTTSYCTTTYCFAALPIVLTNVGSCSFFSPPSGSQAGFFGSSVQAGEDATSCHRAVPCRGVCVIHQCALVIRTGKCFRCLFILFHRYVIRARDRFLFVRVFQKMYQVPTVYMYQGLFCQRRQPK